MLASASVACRSCGCWNRDGVEPGKGLELPASLRVGHRAAILPPPRGTISCMKLRLALLLLMMGSVFVPPRAARACGGGVVTRAQSGTIGADAQRILISVRGGTTDVITQIAVPATTADYGVLASAPERADARPQARLRRPTSTCSTRKRRPTFIDSRDNEGGIPLPSCGCGPRTQAASANRSTAGVHVSQPVTIGPVTAVTLTADTGDAINAWLGRQRLRDPGRRSIARRCTTRGRGATSSRSGAATRRRPAARPASAFTSRSRATSAGLPLRFARLGAATTVAFTVFVAADAVVAPSAPFAALTINDLDRQRPAHLGLRVTRCRALSRSAAITRSCSRALARSRPLSDARSARRCSRSSQPSQTLTRLSTIAARQHARHRRRLRPALFAARSRTSVYTQRTGTRGGQPASPSAPRCWRSRPWHAAGRAVLSRRARRLRSPRPAERGVDRRLGRGVPARYFFEPASLVDRARRVRAISDGGGAPSSSTAPASSPSPGSRSARDRASPDPASADTGRRDRRCRPCRCRPAGSRAASDRGSAPGGDTGQASSTSGTSSPSSSFSGQPGLNGSGCLPCGTLLAHVLVVADAVAIGVGNREAVGAAAAAARAVAGLGVRRRAAEVVRERSAHRPGAAVVAGPRSGLRTWP